MAANARNVPGNGPVWSARRRSGPTREALDAAILARGVAPGLELVASLARDAADLADSARRAQDPRLWLAAAARLLGLAERLGVAASVGPVGAPGDGDRGGELDPLVAEALGARSEVGYPQESGS